MKKVSRRKFVQHSTLATAGTLMIPQFLKAFGSPQRLAASDRKLVVIQWSGGNDGLNAVVPYNNDLYYQKRPNIGIAATEVLRATDELGFHPALSILRDLYDQGDLCVVNNVGYPNPDRSHFRSMDIWQTGSHANEFLSTGWLGRYLDQQQSSPHHALELSDTLSLALKGEQARGFATNNLRQLRNTTKSPLLRAIAQHQHQHEEETVSYLYKTLGQTLQSADYLQEKSNKKAVVGDYPKAGLGSALQQIASLMAGGSDTQIYYANLSGFDTHVNQVAQQERLFKNYSAAVSAFVQDLKQQNLWNNTLVLTFSEFGRRVAENGSRGTDHGAANNVYLMGGQLKKQGFYNQGPNLSRLNEGDLQYEIDFRQIYATILRDWLQGGRERAWFQSFKSLDIV